jgi:hypothetical protein
VNNRIRSHDTQHNVFQSFWGLRDERIVRIEKIMNKKRFPKGGCGYRKCIIGECGREIKGNEGTLVDENKEVSKLEKLSGLF